MPDRISGSDVFSFNRAQRAPTVPLPDQPLGPYADAWKEFDKLQKAVSGHGPFRWVHWGFDLFAFSGGAFGYHLLKGHKLAIGAAFGTVVLAELYSYFSRRDRFLHWPCPRCHGEWPGTKTDKENRCTLCGLRLHQTAP